MHRISRIALAPAILLVAACAKSEPAKDTTAAMAPAAAAPAPAPTLALALQRGGPFGDFDALGEIRWISGAVQAVSSR